MVILVEIAGIVYFSGFFSGALIQLNREVDSYLTDKIIILSHYLIATTIVAIISTFLVVVLVG